MSRPLFDLGRTVATPGALAALVTAEETPDLYLRRHVRGDWGDVPPEDAQANQDALSEDARVFSVYRTRAGERLWVITEADRSSTCLLLPAEY